MIIYTDIYTLYFVFVINLVKYSCYCNGCVISAQMMHVPLELRRGMSPFG